VLLTVAFALAAGCVAAGEAPPAFTTAPTARRAGGSTAIEFAVDRATDVEVAILDAGGKVVRHLAAGVLGGQNPPPDPLKPGLDQRIEWDGRDDHGKPVAHPAACSVRVRCGMGVKLDRIVGGDPYAFYSRQMGQGDHAAWRIMGLEAKADGTVYVLGNANNYGPPALRAYDPAGKYLRTVYPPPAGKPIEAVQGWGVTERADGTYTPQYADLSSPALSRTLIAGTRGRIATLIPSPDQDTLLLTYGFRQMRVHTDGTIPTQPMLEARLVNEPAPVPAERNAWRWTGQMHVCPSADGRHFYLGGVFAGDLGPRGRRIGAETSGFWRDGQVYRVDYATRKAEAFFALDAGTVPSDLSARGKSPIADARYGAYAALQGVAADADGHVFVCDRLNKRVLVLDPDGKTLRQIPVAYPDAVAVHPKSKTLYVTTRTGHYHGEGALTLLKFDDWSTATAPSTTLPLCKVRHFSQPTHLAAVESKGAVYVWVAYTSLPVRVYRDKGDGLELAKDFYQVGSQRALDLQHFIVDQKTADLYVADGFGSCFRITDWSDPKFIRCMVDATTPLRAISLAVDSRNRWLYGHGDRQPVRRYRLDGEFLAAAAVGGSGDNACTPKLSNDWRIGLGKGDRGIAAADDGSLATLAALGTGADYGGYLRFFDADPTRAPWDGLLFERFGRKVRAAGVRFDRRGNLYAGKYDGTVRNPPAGFEKDANFLRSTGRIYKYAPTGSFESGNLFPTQPDAPARVYDVHYGAIGPRFSRTPGFAVDGYGRIYYPTSLLPCVSVIDNEGNAILRFGTYGNRDSTGGLPGDAVPTRDVPMAWPNCVDATDDSIYVSDIVNIRLLRLAKQFKLEALLRAKQTE
jgi:outer membrane protein assembly factor BamB